MTELERFRAGSTHFWLDFVINLRNPVKISRNLAMSFPESNMAGRLTDRATIDRPWHGPQSR